MSPELLLRVRAALRDAEQWTAKYIADNHERAEPGMPLEAAVRSLARITATYTEVGRLQ